MAPDFSERLENGDRVKHDQTVTLRVHHAKRKVRGRLTSQCPGGCGIYLAEDERAQHICPGPPQPRKKQIRRPRARLNKAAYRKALKEAQKAGKLKEFLDAPWPPTPSNS